MSKSKATFRKVHEKIYDSNVRVMSKVCGRRKREIRCDQDFYSRCLRYEARFKKYLIVIYINLYKSKSKREKCHIK